MNDRARPVLDFILREWLLMAAITGLLVTSVYLQRLPHYGRQQITPIFLLLALFVVVKGIENSGALVRLGLALERGGQLPLKLVLITFLLSMVVTIDVALVTMLPLTLALNIRQRDRLAILVALTAHAGAALTPFGTPQNLFIFSFYGVAAADFVRVIAPFALGMLALFLLAALWVDATPLAPQEEASGSVDRRAALIHGALLLLVVLCVLRLLPVPVALVAIAYSLLFDRRSLRIDYALLATFLCFIGLAGNVRELLASTIQHTGHVFVISSLLSQFISNVPTTLLMTRFTEEWEALLWGVNVGGFGSLMGALANLITYRLYAARADGRATAAFTLRFVAAGYAAFGAGILLYFGLERL